MHGGPSRARLRWARRRITAVREPAAVEHERVVGEGRARVCDQALGLGEVGGRPRQTPEGGRGPCAKAGAAMTASSARRRRSTAAAPSRVRTPASTAARRRAAAAFAARPRPVRRTTLPRAVPRVGRDGRESGAGRGSPRSSRAPPSSRRSGGAGRGRAPARRRAPAGRPRTSAATAATLRSNSSVISEQRAGEQHREICGGGGGRRRLGAGYDLGGEPVPDHRQRCGQRRSGPRRPEPAPRAGSATPPGAEAVAPAALDLRRERHPHRPRPAPGRGEADDVVRAHGDVAPAGEARPAASGSTPPETSARDRSSRACMPSSPTNRR